MCSVAIAASTTVFVTSVAAQEATTAEPGAAASAEARSSRLREQANVAYGEGRYAEALALLEQANAAAPYDLHEFNLGAVHDQMGHCEQARDHFEAFLRIEREAPSAPEEEARHALSELYERCGHATATEDTKAAGSAEAAGGAEESVRPGSDAAAVGELPVIPALGPAGARRGAPGAGSDGSSRGTPWRRTLGVGLLGGAAAAGIAAVVAGIRVESAEDDLRALARRNPSTVTGKEINALYSRGQRYQSLSVGLGVASAVLAGAGATLLVLELTDDSALEVASGGNAGLTYRQRF